MKRNKSKNHLGRNLFGLSFPASLFLSLGYLQIKIDVFGTLEEK